MPDAREPSIVVDAWFVADGNQEEFLSAMVALMERLQALDGFCEGQILSGVDHTRFVSWVTFSSTRAREAAFLDRETSELRRRLGGITREHPHAYAVTQRFGARES